jgi:hypothetical protein
MEVVERMYINGSDDLIISKSVLQVEGSHFGAFSSYVSKKSTASQKKLSTIKTDFPGSVYYNAMLI